MNKILAIMPISIGGRLTTSSFIDGFIQNGFEVIVYDELKNDNFLDYLSDDFEYIIGYDFSPIKLKKDYKGDEKYGGENTKASCPFSDKG